MSAPPAPKKSQRSRASPRGSYTTKGRSAFSSSTLKGPLNFDGNTMQLSQDSCFGMSQPASQESINFTQESFKFTPAEQSIKLQSRPGAPSPRTKRPRATYATAEPSSRADEWNKHDSDADTDMGRTPARPKRAQKLRPANTNIFLQSSGTRKRPRPSIRFPNVEGGVLSRYLEEFCELDRIGHGSFASVFRCKRRDDGCQYAVKRINKAVMEGKKKQRELVLREVYALSALADCPYIVGYFTSWFENDPGRGDMLYIQLEYCDATLEAVALGDASASGDVDSTFGVGQLQIADDDEEGDEKDVRSSTGSLLAGGTVTPELPSRASLDFGLARQSIDEEAEYSRPSPMLFKAPSIAPSSRQRARAVLPEDLLLLVLHDIAQALRTMHSRSIVHLDVKPGNILLSRWAQSPVTIRTSQQGSLAAMAGGNVHGSGFNDAQFAGALHDNKFAPVSRPSQLAEAEKKYPVVFKLGDMGQVQHATIDPSKSSAMEGDALYVCRCLLEGSNPCLPSADIFSLGISLFEMASGKALEGGPVGAQLRNGHVPRLSTCSHQFMDLIKAMMHPDPLSRPSAADILLHPLITGTVKASPRGASLRAMATAGAGAGAGAGQYSRQGAVRRSSVSTCDSTTSLSTSPTSMSSISGDIHYPSPVVTGLRRTPGTASSVGTNGRRDSLGGTPRVPAPHAHMHTPGHAGQPFTPSPSVSDSSMHSLSSTQLRQLILKERSQFSAEISRLQVALQQATGAHGSSSSSSGTVTNGIAGSTSSSAKAPFSMSSSHKSAKSPRMGAAPPPPPSPVPTLSAATLGSPFQVSPEPSPARTIGRATPKARPTRADFVGFVSPPLFQVPDSSLTALSQHMTHHGRSSSSSATTARFAHTPSASTSTAFATSGAVGASGTSALGSSLFGTASDASSASTVTSTIASPFAAKTTFASSTSSTNSNSSRSSSRSSSSSTTSSHSHRAGRAIGARRHTKFASTRGTATAKFSYVA